MRRTTLRPARSSRRPKQPPPEPEKTEEKVEEKIEVPPSPAPAVAALPPPRSVKPEPPKPKPQPPVPTTTAPQRQRTASLVVVNSWHSRIVGLIERNKAYPPAAQARGETGVVQLAFSIDRQGHVLASQVVRSSGSRGARPGDPGDRAPRAALPAAAGRSARAPSSISPCRSGSISARAGARSFPRTGTHFSGSCSIHSHPAAVDPVLDGP